MPFLKRTPKVYQPPDATPAMLKGYIDALSVGQQGGLAGSFRMFCENQFTAENIDFLLAVRGYKKGPLITVARGIYNTFIKESAARQVNIAAATRADLDNLIRDQPYFPPIDLFDKAENEVEGLLARDRLRAFIDHHAREFEALEKRPMFGAKFVRNLFGRAS